MVKLTSMIIGLLGVPVLLQAATPAVPDCTVKIPVVTVTTKQPVFSVRLPSNPTTGYRWFLRDAPAELAPLGSTYVASPRSRGLVGAGGEEVWRFRAAATKVPRQWTLHFVYARSFESGEAEGFACQVSVLPAG